METIQLKRSDFPGYSGRYVICNVWGICFETIWREKEDAIRYYDMKGLEYTSEFYRCSIKEVEWI